jgi:hypothetical protein
MTQTPAIPADINDLQSIAGTLSDMISMASQAHSNCDLGSETECSGEQYGDGSADEHCRLRDAEATIEALKAHRATVAKAPRAHSDLDTIDLDHDLGIKDLTPFGEEF